MIHLDTHVVVWLYNADSKRFSPKARKVIDSNDLHISPFVRLELQYLYEIGKLNSPPLDLLKALASLSGLTSSSCDIEDLVESALHESWTRDPFDRLIVAQARLQGVRLISADRRIAENFEFTVW